MRGVTEFILSLFELLEAEGRLLRNNVGRTGAGCLIAGMGIFFIGGSLAFLVTAIYELLRVYVSAPMAFLLLAACCMAIGLGLLLFGRLYNRRHRRRSYGKKSPGNVS